MLILDVVGFHLTGEIAIRPKARGQGADLR
jgi:hypothetical protein